MLTLDPMLTERGLQRHIDSLTCEDVTETALDFLIDLDEMEYEIDR